MALVLLFIFIVDLRAFIPGHSSQEAPSSRCAPANSSICHPATGILYATDVRHASSTSPPVSEDPTLAGEERGQRGPATTSKPPAHNATRSCITLLNRSIRDLCGPPHIVRAEPPGGLFFAAANDRLDPLSTNLRAAGPVQADEADAEPIASADCHTVTSVNGLATVGTLAKRRFQAEVKGRLLGGGRMGNAVMGHRGLALGLAFDVFMPAPLPNAKRRSAGSVYAGRLRT